jgi:hypothetical protein
MPHPRFSSEEIARRGQELYQQAIRAQVETAGNRGKFLLIDIETGDYEMDTDEFAASRRAHAKHPDGAFFGMRIGYRSSGTIGASAFGVSR